MRCEAVRRSWRRHGQAVAALGAGRIVQQPWNRNRVVEWGHNERLRVRAGSVGLDRPCLSRIAGPILGNLARDRIRAQRPAEEEYVRLRPAQAAAGSARRRAWIAAGANGCTRVGCARQIGRARRSLVDGVVLPSSGLLDADSPPFVLGKQPVFRAFARYLGGQNNMPEQRIIRVRKGVMGTLFQ
jgi:hypothetical protein